MLTSTLLKAESEASESHIQVHSFEFQLNLSSPLQLTKKTDGIFCGTPAESFFSDETYRFFFQTDL